jgi:hypothetical protein
MLYTFNFLVGAHPDPSIVCSLNKLKEKVVRIRFQGKIPISNPEYNASFKTHSTTLLIYLKHICPSSFIFGCHILVLQLASGGFNNEKSPRYVFGSTSLLG